MLCELNEGMLGALVELSSGQLPTAAEYATGMTAIPAPPSGAGRRSHRPSWVRPRPDRNPSGGHASKVARSIALATMHPTRRAAIFAPQLLPVGLGRLQRTFSISSGGLPAVVAVLLGDDRKPPTG